MNTINVSIPEPVGFDWNSLTAKEYAYIWADTRSPRWIHAPRCQEEILAARAEGSSIDKEKASFFDDDRVNRLVDAIETIDVSDAHVAYRSEGSLPRGISAWRKYIWYGGDRPRYKLDIPIPSGAVVCSCTGSDLTSSRILFFKKSCAVPSGCHHCWAHRLVDKELTDGETLVVGRMESLIQPCEDDSVGVFVFGETHFPKDNLFVISDKPLDFIWTSPKQILKVNHAPEYLLALAENVFKSIVRAE